MKINLQKMILGAILATSICSVYAAPKFNSKKSITVLSREDGSGTRGAFIELFGIEKKDESNNHIFDIGYVSLGSLNNSVKAVKIDGAVATVSNINNGSYKISRPFNIAVKEGLTPVAQDFVNFILSDKGQKVIAANKYIQVAAKSYISSKASGKIVVAGSSSVSPVMEKLIEAYKSENPNAKIELQTSDSTTGVTNAINGTCDIGMASRSLKDSEKSKGVQEVTIAIDGIAVIVNKSNPTENLSKAQVEQIFTGKTLKWNEVK